jgi:hypothetical protein
VLWFPFLVKTGIIKHRNPAEKAKTPSLAGFFPPYHAALLWVASYGTGSIYFIFGPARQPIKGQPPGESDEVPIHPEGQSWNPIQGTNRMAEGEGLNSRNTGP